MEGIQEILLVAPVKLPAQIHKNMWFRDIAIAWTARGVADEFFGNFLWLPRRLLSAWSGVRAWTFPITPVFVEPTK